MLIGPNFANELQAAGLLGLPFTWNGLGEFNFSEAMTQLQIDAVLAVFAAHDPTAPDSTIAWANYVQLAKDALVESDRVATRCYKDRILYPETWNTYDNLLRVIVNTVGIGNFLAALPTRPIFPVKEGALSLNVIADLSAKTQNVSPSSGDAIQLEAGSHDGMLAIILSAPIAELTILMPQESGTRPNQIRKIGASHAIDKVTYLPYSGDTVAILEAPSSINADEPFTLQHSEPAIWCRVN